MTNWTKKHWGWIAMAIVAVAVGIITDSGSVAAFAALPFLGFRSLLLDEFGEGGGGGGGGGGEFQSKVLDGIGKVRSAQEAIEKNFATLDKDAKKTAEDFAKHVKEFEGLPSQIGDISRSLSKIQLKVSQEARASHGSGIARISADPECRNAVNGIIRSSLRLQGKHVPMTEEQEQGAKDYREAMTKAMSTGSGSGAAYINSQLIPDIYSVVAEYGIWNRFDVVPVSTASAKLIVDSTDPVMAWTAENTASAETSYTSANVAATIGKMLGWIQVSNELLEDAEIDLSGHILSKFANATAYRLDFAATDANGDADTVDGGYSGIFHAGTASIAVATHTSVAKLDLQDFLNCMLAVDASVLSKPTTGWVIHPQQLVRVLGVKDGNGRPLFLPSTDAPSLGAIGSILGFPVVLSHAAPAVDGVSKKIAVFGDLMGNAVCLRSDFEFAASDQAKFTEDSTVFRARARGASKVKKATSFGILTTAAA